MKKLLFLAILISSTFFAQAQKNAKSPTERAQSKVDKLGEAVNLSDTQKEQVYALFLEQNQNGKMGGKKMSEFTKEERQAYLAQRKEQRAAFDSKMSEILTPAQYATYQEKNKGYGKGQKKGQGKHNGKGSMSSEEKIQRRVDGMTERLQLTATQQAQVSALLKEQATNRPEKGARKDFSEAEKAEAKAAKKATKAAFDAQMKDILSPEQYVTFQNEKMDHKKAGKHKKGGAKNKEGMEQKKTGTNKKGGLKSKEEMVQRKLDKLTEQLQLTPAQQGQVEAVLTVRQASIQPAKRTAKDKSPAAKEARKAEKAAFDDKMKNILSAEQYATFQAANKSERRKGNGRKHLKKMRKAKKQ